MPGWGRNGSEPDLTMTGSRRLINNIGSKPGTGNSKTLAHEGREGEMTYREFRIHSTTVDRCRTRASGHGRRGRRAGAPRQMVQRRASPLLRRRRGGRCLRHDRLQRRKAGGRRHRRPGRLRLLRLGARRRWCSSFARPSASQPDGIAMMGHPGDAAIMPLAEEASKAASR